MRYIFAMTAVKNLTKTIKYVTDVGSCVANSDAEAYGVAMLRCLNKFPTTKEWQGHIVAVRLDTVFNIGV